MAIGVASIGVGVGTMAMAPLAGWVVKVYGWRVGFILMGGIVLVIGVVLSQWFMGKTRPEDYGLLPDGGGGTERGGDPAPDGGPRLGPSLGQVLRDSRFWILAVCYSLAVMAEMSAMVHQVRLCPGSADRQGGRGLVPGDDRHGQHPRPVFLRVVERPHPGCQVCIRPWSFYS